MTTNVKIRIAQILITLYAVYVLINALLYYFVILPGETDILRAIGRTIGVGLVIYFLEKRSALAYWIAMVCSGVFAVFGILAAYLIAVGEGFGMLSATYMIPFALLATAFAFLIPSQVRKEFK